MVDPALFRAVIRDGARAGNAAVVVHCRTDEGRATPLVGFVVPKREIALATKRNRLRRQVRHLIAARLATMPSNIALVIRINGNAVGLASAELGVRLDNAMSRALRKWHDKAGVL